MRFPKTQHKIGEAQFFFDLMDGHAKGAIFQNDGSWWDENLTKFRYYLSAFLSAGMSIRDAVLPKESSEVLGKNTAKKVFSDWFAAWERDLSQRDRRVWDSMKKRRDDEVHLADMNLQRKTGLLPLSKAPWRRNTQRPKRFPPHAGGVPPDWGESIRIGVLAPVWPKPNGKSVKVLSECKPI